MEDMQASKPSNMRFVLDLFEADNAIRTRSAYATDLCYSGSSHIPNWVLGLVLGMVRFVLRAPVLENLRFACTFEIQHALLADFILL